MADPADEHRGKRMIRVAQLLLIVAAIGLWAAARVTWVQLEVFDGLGQPKTVTLSGSTWSTALLPVALLLAAATVAALAVRGWPLRALAVLLAVVSLGTAYLGISQWVVPDIAVRAADLVQVPVAWLVGSQRYYWGAVITLGVAVLTLIAAVLLIRSASTGRAATTRYLAPGARRDAVRAESQVPSAGPADSPSAGETSDSMSERMMWDALDEGRDPTEPQSGTDNGTDAGPPSEGR